MHKGKVLGIWTLVCALALALAAWANAAAPSGFKEANIGEPDEAGSVTVGANGAWTVNGAGNQFDGNSEDQLYFVYKTIRGNGSARARLMRESSPAQQYIGVMIRASLDANAPFAGLIHSTSALNWIYRTDVDEIAIRQSGVSPENYPKRMLVQRVGNAITGFTSSDGKLWQQIAGPLELPLEDTAEIGLAVSSRDPSTLTRTELQEVEVLEGVTTVYGVESAANENAALLTWQTISSAAGYMVYRGPKNATTIAQLTALTTAPQTEPSYLDTNRPDVSFRELQYAVSAVYKAADGSLVEGPVLRLR